MKGIKFETPFSKEVKTRKHNTGKPNINPVKNKAKEDKINQKRQENFGYINKESWEKIRDEKKSLEDK